MRTLQILRRASIAQTCADAMIGAVAGLALYSSFPPLGWWWMSIPALALFISRIDEARAPRALGVTLSFGMSMWLPLIDWIPMAVGTRAAWFVLAFVQTLFLCAWVVFVRWTSLWRAARSPLAQALLYAISWAGVDALAVVGLPVGFGGLASGGFPARASRARRRDEPRCGRRRLYRRSPAPVVRRARWGLCP